MNNQKTINLKRERRTNRTRAKISGTAQKPRLAIFRSNRFLYAQLIDDEKSHTLASVSTRTLKAEDRKKKPSEQAMVIGEAIAKKGVELGIKEVVLDRRSYKFHGRILRLAEGVKKGGIKI